MYAAKKILALLSQPGTIALLLVATAITLHLMKRTRAARALFISGALFAWLIATPLVGGWLLRPLESRFAPLTRIPGNVRYVVVLGSSYTPGNHLPVTAALDEAGLRRLVEGVRLQRLIPGSRLVVSGGATQAGNAPALGNGLLARDLGVPPESLVHLLKAVDTRGEAAEISKLTGSDRCLLVTSAAHMPRAMEYLRLAGGLATAAPTGQLTANSAFSLSVLIPSSQGLGMSEAAIHEYLGWLALKTDVF